MGLALLTRTSKTAEATVRLRRLGSGVSVGVHRRRRGRTWRIFDHSVEIGHVVVVLAASLG